MCVCIWINFLNLSTFYLFNFPLILKVHCTLHYKKTGLLRRFFCGRCKKSRYISPIVAFFWTVAVHRIYCGIFWDHRYGIVFCGILQQRDIKPSPYICFSGDNVDIVALQTPAAINTSFCVDTIAVVEKNRRNMLSIAAVCMTATIGILFAVLLLDIVAVWTIAINLWISQLHNFPLFFSPSHLKIKS